VTFGLTITGSGVHEQMSAGLRVRPGVRAKCVALWATGWDKMQREHSEKESNENGSGASGYSGITIIFSQQLAHYSMSAESSRRAAGRLSAIPPSRGPIPRGMIRFPAA